MGDAANEEGEPAQPWPEGANWKGTAVKDVKTKLKSIRKVKMLKRICFEMKILRKGELRL